MAHGPDVANQARSEAAARERALRGLLPGLSYRLWLARLALLWERLWPALWPTAGVLGLFLTLALFDVLPDLPVWLHVAVLVLFVGALTAALWRGFSGLSFPNIINARRRIELQSALLHRPLNAVAVRILGDGAERNFVLVQLLAQGAEQLGALPFRPHGPAAP